MTEEGSGQPVAKRMWWRMATGALFLLFLLLLFLRWPSSDLPRTFPSEIEHLDRQIRAAGIIDLFPDQYAAFHQQVSDLRNHWRQESGRWLPSWPIEEFTESYQHLIASGTTLLTAAQQKKTALREQLTTIVKGEQAQLRRLRNLNGLFDLRGKRTALSRAESFLTQATSHLAHERFEAVAPLLKQARESLSPVEIFAIEQMSRYANSRQIGQWNRWVTDTLDQSRRTGSPVIVVIKSSQEFRLYRNGRLHYTFPSDLGFSGLQDKRYEGDGATPEGIFHIVQKKSAGETRFYKALMLDFPTPMHQRRFQKAKVRGLIPANRGIGGLIEIHGQPSGGNDLTNGCVALDNTLMDKLFPLVPLKTPVVIVGALASANPVSARLTPIYEHHTTRQGIPLLSFNRPSGSSID